MFSILIMFINVELILIRSTQAAGIVQGTFGEEAGEVQGGKEETTVGYFYRYFYHSV